MYINPFLNKLHETHPEDVLTHQLIGWVYESHAWVIADEDKQNHKTCKWCGATSTVDMVCDDEEKLLCYENPLIRVLLFPGHHRIGPQIKSLIKTGEGGKDV